MKCALFKTKNLSCLLDGVGGEACGCEAREDAALGGRERRQRDRGQQQRQQVRLKLMFIEHDNHKHTHVRIHYNLRRSNVGQTTTETYLCAGSYVFFYPRVLDDP